MQNATDQQDLEREESLHLYRVLARSYKSIAEISSISTKLHGLNQTEFAVLEFLFHKGRQPLQKIGTSLLLQSGGVTYVIDKMEKHGLLQREPCPKDRRVTYAALTPDGHDLMQRVFPSHAATMHEAMNGLSMEEKKTAADLLKRLGLYADKKRTRLTRELAMESAQEEPLSRRS